MRDHESTDLDGAAKLAADEAMPEPPPSPSEIEPITERERMAFEARECVTEGHHEVEILEVNQRLNSELAVCRRCGAQWRFVLVRGVTID